MNQIPSPQDCCAPCPAVAVQQIQGPKGDPGSNGTIGSDGQDGFTRIASAGSSVPVVNGSATVNVLDSDPFGIQEEVFLDNLGYFRVTAKPNANQLTLYNPPQYSTFNAAPGTPIPNGTLLVPGGRQGLPGDSGVSTLNSVSPTTTKGDIIADNGGNNPNANDVRLGVGTDGQALVANSGQPTGLKWTTIHPNSVTADKTVPRYNGASGTPTPIQDSKVIITDDGAIQATGSGGNARGLDATDLQVQRSAATMVASATRSVITGGTNNTASGVNSGVLTGTNGIAAGQQSAVVTGDSNQASAKNSAVLCGHGALADKPSQIAHAPNLFAAQGDCQSSELVAMSSTTDATPTALGLTSSASGFITIPTNTTWTFQIRLAGRSSAGVSFGLIAYGVIQNNAGTTALVGSPTKTVAGDGTGGTWGVAGALTIAADDTNDALSLLVTGAGATSIRWSACVLLTEVSF